MHYSRVEVPEFERKGEITLSVPSF